MHIEVPDIGHSIAAAHRLRRLASFASLMVAILLVAAKAGAWFVTDSLSLLASLIDAFIDVAAALVTTLGVQLAIRPADAMHRFGHGKAEALAALIQALLLAGAACVLFFDGMYRLVVPSAVSHLSVGVGVTAVSTVFTLALIGFQTYVTRRAPSQAIAADRTHHVTDVVANLAVLLALGLTSLTGWQRFDPLFAIAIAAFFGWSAFAIAWPATDTLLDHELPAEERHRITQVVMAHRAARGIHDLRTRASGHAQFIEFHLELDGALSVRGAHAIADEIEQLLKIERPSSEVLIHVEPAGIIDERLDDRFV